MKKFWRKYHKWVGLFFSFFILMFCFSGVVLNHRKALSKFEVSRSWMPSDYKFENWNNGIIRGTESLSDGTVLCYGNTGVWQTDSCLSVYKPLNEGLKEGIDNRKISNIVTMPDGSVWCAGLYDFYRLGANHRWEIQQSPADGDRIADITNRQDTLVVLTRSHVYEAKAPYQTFTRHELPKPDNYSPKVPLFRTVWLLHSGELFGLPGQLFVDAMAIVMCILCITGLIYTFVPPIIRRRKKKQKKTKRAANTMKVSVKWHNRLGTWLIIPTVLLAVTGMSLRPPMMIPFVLCSTKPVPGSTMDSENPWHDKLRGIRWDEHFQQWLLSTSSGFYQLADFKSMPRAMKATPPVSPMGINVFEQKEPGVWLVGSFSGIYSWKPEKQIVNDYLTGRSYDPSQRSFFGSSTVTGYSDDFSQADEVIFDYGTGARTAKNQQIHLSDMPQELKTQPMSLWNFALELHVGRCYSPFLGPLSSMFVFLAGLLLTLTLISGYILRPRKKKKKKGSTPTKAVHKQV